MRPAPPFATTLNTEYITGLGTVDERMPTLVDIERVMTGVDVALVDSALQ